MNHQSKINIIKASAGTGKTYTLVEFFFKILLSNPQNYFHALGLTFTKKAAAEMKERILKKTIQEISDSSNSLTVKEILSNILFNYSRFDFQTIDSFFHKIIKIFSKDLEIPPNFKIEEDEELFSELCLQQLYHESAHETELKNYLMEFILFSLENKDNWNIDFPLIELIGELQKDSTQKYLPFLRNKSLDDFRQRKDFHFSKIQDFEHKVNSQIDELEKNLEHLWNNLDIWKGKNRGLPSKLKKLKKLRELRYEDIKKILSFLYDENNYFSEPFRYTNETKSIKSFYSSINQLFDYSKWKEYKTHLIAYYSIQTTALFSKIYEIAEKIKSENQFILMSDIHLKIKEFIEKEPPEYLYWRMGQRYHFFMLDEFQDTSVTQFNNLKPLIETVIDTKPHEYSILVVGDVKQSIYRWRGSNPLLLQNLHQSNYFNQSLVKQLHINFRSSPVIVKFVNDFFNHIAQQYKEYFNLVKTNFSGLNQTAHHDYPGFVILQKICTPNIQNNNKETEELTSKQEIILKLLLETIKKYEHKGLSIAILVRTNSESRIIADFLTQHQITFTASESLLLSQSPLIQFLFETLKWINFPDNALSFLTAQNLAKNLDIAWNTSQLSDFSKELRRLNLYEQAERLVDFLGLYQNLDNQIIHFLQFVHHYENQDYKKNLSFWEWFERYAQKESFISNTTDAIQIMTIHQSKGLEFDIVLCPFLNWDLYPKANTKYWGIFNEYPYLLNYSSQQKDTLFTTEENILAYEKETQETILENTNLLYVAITRAKYGFWGCFYERKENTEWKKVSDYFQSYLSQLQNDSSIIQKNGFQVYIQGNEELTPEKIPSQNEVFTISSLEFCSPSSKIILKPIEKEDWEILLKRKQAIEKGTIIHKILEETQYFVDLDRVIEHFVLQGKISENQKNTIKEKITKLFENPLVQLWFSEKVTVLKEQKFLQVHEESKIVDRIVFHEDILYLIDFKTGQKYPEHIEQIKDYEQVIQQSDLKQIKNYKMIKKFLMYLDSNEIVEIE